MDIQATYTNAAIELIAAYDTATSPMLRDDMLTAIRRFHATWLSTADADALVRALDTLYHRIGCWLVGRDPSEPISLHLSKDSDILADLALYIDLM